MKQVIVTFNFDPETEQVSDVRCTIDGVEKKKKTTKKIKEVKEELASEALITLEPNKLVFNNKAISDMEIEYEDRVVIKWQQAGKKMIPVIGKDLAFEEEGTGNKVTKSNTITYKGKANTVLADFGSEFTIEEIKAGIWKLIPKNGTSESVVEESTLQDVIEKAENTELDLLVSTDEETEIDDLQFQL